MSSELIYCAMNVTVKFLCSGFFPPETGFLCYAQGLYMCLVGEIEVALVLGLVIYNVKNLKQVILSFWK